MSAHRVRYEGPRALAVKVATLLADAPGVKLTSAGAPDRGAGEGADAGLTVTLEGMLDAVQAAVERVQGQLPDDARLTIL